MIPELQVWSHTARLIALAAALWSCGELLGLDADVPCQLDGDCPGGYVCRAPVCMLPSESSVDSLVPSQGGSSGSSSDITSGAAGATSAAAGGNGATAGRDPSTGGVEQAGAGATLDAGDPETVDPDADTEPCRGTPSASCAPACGDGVLHAGEECDDGNRRPGDGCAKHCAVERLALGTGHACVILRNGGVKCWGNNEFGQLGIGVIDGNFIGDEPGEMGAALQPVMLGPGARVVALAAGTRHTCAVFDGGALKCWGAGDDGQLAQGNSDNVSRPDAVAPIFLGTERLALAVTAGARHTCALLDDGAVTCFGYAIDGRLGVPPPPGPFPFFGDDPGETGGADTLVPLRSKALSIAGGSDQTCALLDDGSVWCWGIDETGQLGETPAPVALGDGALAVALWAGNFSTCAELDSGLIRCWGTNPFGQLGAGDVFSRGVATGNLPFLELGSDSPVLTLALGGSHHCALLESRAIKCWGLAERLGLGLADAAQSLGDQPGEMGAALPALALGNGALPQFIAARGQYSCATFEDGSVKCWGREQFGRLGLGNSPDYRELAGDVVGDAASELGDALPALDLSL